MSHFILVCERDELRDAGRLSDYLDRCARLQWPRGVDPHATRIIREAGVVLAIVDPAESLPVHGANVCLGRFLDEPGDWWRIGTRPPDGTYALCRSSAEIVEIITDIVASRSVWYYYDKHMFLAASAQRPLVALLGGLDLDSEAVTWMVSSRCLGVRPSYDRRLRRAPLDGSVRLDRRSWTLDITSQWAPYEAEQLSDAQHVRRLNDAIVETCGYLASEADRWPLLLSGGYDSRALLVGMRQAGVTPPCVTWGVESALQDQDSDAAIARRLTETVGAPHTYFSLDGDHVDVGETLEEFVARSEGQVMDVTMYADGFAAWRTLSRQDAIGVIRGDNYPWAYLARFTTPRTVRLHCSAGLLSDYSRGHVIHRLGLTTQTWPADLEPQPDEDLLRYRDRLQRAFYIPNRVVPLNQIKASYVEVCNPLEARRIADVVMRLPERLRLHPAALGQVLAAHGPPVPFASRPAASLPLLLGTAELRLAVAAGLASGAARRLYDASALDDVVATLSRPPGPAARAGFTRKVRLMLPRKVKDRMLPFTGFPLDTTELGLRMFIAARAVDLFESDVQRLGASPLATAPSASSKRA